MTVSKLVCKLLSYLDSSNNYSLKQKRLLSHVKADERTRTVNLLITNQLLCQLSHIGVFCLLQLNCDQPTDLYY